MEKITLTNGQEIPSDSILFNVVVPIDNGIQIKTPISLVQYDSSMAVICFRILENNKQYIPPEGASVNIRMKKPDKHEVYNPVAGQDSNGNIYVLVTSQMTAAFGEGECSIEIKTDGKQKNTKAIPVYISENPVSEANIESADEFQSIADIVEEIKELSKIITENKEVINGIYENIPEIQDVSKNMDSIENASNNINNINIVARNETAIQAVLENIDDIKNAPSYASEAKQSAQNAEQQANNASQSAENASRSESSAQQQATKAEEQATAASQSASSASESATNAQNSLTQAIQKANEAAQSASAASQSEQNAQSSAESAASDKEQAAQSAQSAATSASSASSDANRAESAAERAEQIAGFDPSQFATAEQGRKADTALQPGALDDYATKSEIPTKLPNPQILNIQVGSSATSNNYDGSLPVTVAISTETIGAATTEQGQKADTAVQPEDLNSYATKEEIPSELPNPQSLTIQLNGQSQTAYNGSEEKTINITASSIGAKPADEPSGLEPLIGKTTDITPQQVTDAINQGRQVIIEYTDTFGDSIKFSSWTIEDSDGYSIIFSSGIIYNGFGASIFTLYGYEGSWELSQTSGNGLTPVVDSGDSGKVLTVNSSGKWEALASSSGGMSMTLLWTNTSYSDGMSTGYLIPITSFMNYNIIGVIPFCNLEVNQLTGSMQFFETSSNSTVNLSSICVKTNRPEVQSRTLQFVAGSGIRAGGGFRFDYFDSGANDMACVPYKIYGIKF